MAETKIYNNNYEKIYKTAGHWSKLCIVMKTNF